MDSEAQELITRLGLAPLPHEGGFFRQTWSSSQKLAGGRAAGSAIYFLITPDGFSALHRLKTDELWFFHAGDAVEHVQIDRTVRITRLGADLLAGETPQLVVSAGIWQGARLDVGYKRGWALVSCTMAPAWDENEFELGARATLQQDFPEAATWIEALTR